MTMPKVDCLTRGPQWCPALGPSLALGGPVGGNETEIDIALVGKNNRKYLKDVKTIPCELQHRLVVTDIDKGKLKKVVRNEQTFGRTVWKLKENNMKAKFQERVRELIDVDAPNL